MNRKEKSAQTKTRILEAGRALMRNQGFEGTSVEEICQNANVSTGSFYHYFDSKAALMQQLFDETSGFYKELQYDVEKDSPYDMLRRLVECTTKAYFAFPDNAVYNALFLNPKGNKLMFDRRRPEHQYLYDSLMKLKKAGKFKEGTDVSDVFNKLIACRHGTIYRLRSMEEEDRMEEEAMDILCRMLDSYLQK